MQSIRRGVPAAALALLALPLAVVPPALRAAAAAADPPVGDTALAGHLAYVTAGGLINEVTVAADGTTSDPLRLGPVTKVAAPKTVEASGMVASGDGTLLAWSEVVYKPSARYGRLQSGVVLVVRNMSSGDVTTLRTSSYPLGFAGHTLVASGAYTKRLVMTPSPHLVKVHDGDAYAVATYPKGVVDVASSVPRSSKVVERDKLRLTTFGGHHTRLHTYDVGLDYRSVAANIDAVSPDGTKLVVERGNHQDFEGLGPTSRFDTYSLVGDHARHQLGQYGTNKAKWRLAGATFAGADNQVWLALHSGPGSKASGYAVRGVIVNEVGGRLERVRDGIAVAGNQAGYLVIQDGTWKPVKH
ncbi:MAG TPA: hypothetical protein VHE57_15415, partial [Mycobacteriales bacterium]|nr:hypothetical protein [Mycobacteriales bacterium]